MPFGRLSIVMLFASLCPLIPLPGAAQEAVFIIRHAEQVTEGDDPPLEAVGHQRAARLPVVLGNAGISAIYTSESQRTIQTAQPLAKALGIESRIVPRREVEALLGRLRSEHPRDRVLVVSHSLTIPVLLRALGHTAEVTIGRDEYDGVLVVLPRPGTAPVVLRLRF
jgi:broad specificity phosphatase PhoE